MTRKHKLKHFLKHIGKNKHYTVAVLSLSFLIMFLMLWISTVDLHALERGVPLNRYIMDEWDYKSNYPADGAMQIAQTPDGYLWFASDNGLLRYDGITFDVIKVEGDLKGTSPRVYTVEVDKNGRIWAGTRGGILEYDEHTGMMLQHNREDGFPVAHVSDLKADSYGALWISTYGSGLFRHKDGQLKSFNASDGLDCSWIYTITEDRKGKMWICAMDDGLYVGQNNRFVKFDIPALKIEYTVYRVFLDTNGDLWIGTNRGLILVDHQQKTSIFTIKDGLPDNMAEGSIIKDSDGNIWASTAVGMVRITRKAGSSITIESFPKLSSYCLFEDKEKSLWLASLSSGIRQLRNNSFKTYDHRHGLYGYLNSLYKDEKGGMWIGSTMGHMHYFKDGVFKEILHLDPITEMGILSIQEDQNGTLWFGTYRRGLFRLKDGMTTRYTTKDGLYDTFVRTLFCDSKNQLWIGTSMGGFSRLDCSEKELHFRSYNVSDGLLSNTVNNFFEDQYGDIWIATANGINVLKGGTWDGGSKTYLKKTYVCDLFQDEKARAHDQLWISTEGRGLFRLDMAEGKLATVNTDKGLGNNYVRSIIEDRWENFWITCKSGLLKVDKNELNALADGTISRIKCISFGMGDGLPGSQNKSYSKNNAVKAPNNDLWFSTNHGIAAVDPGKIKINQLPPPVALKSVMFNFEPISPKQSGESFQGIKDVRFQFTANTFVVPRKATLKYRLEGYEDHWQTAKPYQERKVAYKNLPFGSYTFRVIACNSSGIWNTTGSAFSFTLKPYFYQTITFKVLFILLFSISLFMTYVGLRRLVYMRKLKKKYRNSTLDPEKAESSLAKLMYLLEEKKVYKDESLTLNTLAEQLSIAPRYLSQIVNERLNKKLRDLLNDYRIEEAKYMMANPGGKEFTILDIAYESGFNSKESFYRAFRRVTGMTPREFIKSEKDQ